MSNSPRSHAQILVRWLNEQSPKQANESRAVALPAMILRSGWAQVSLFLLSKEGSDKNLGELITKGINEILDTTLEQDPTKWLGTVSYETLLLIDETAVQVAVWVSRWLQTKPSPTSGGSDAST